MDAKPKLTRESRVSHKIHNPLILVEGLEKMAICSKKTSNVTLPNRPTKHIGVNQQLVPEIVGSLSVNELEVNETSK
jgi:hypothetical protein